MSSFCMGCGKSLAEGERFCAGCGRDSTATAVPRVDPAVAFGLPPETSGKAIFSLVSGLIVFFPPFSISAVIFGHLAISDIRKSPGRLTGRGLAIAGIVLGYLGAAFYAGLIGLGIYEYRMDEKQGTKQHLTYSAPGGESSVIASLRTLNTAEIAYSQGHRATGYTCSLSDLTGAWGVSRQLATGKKNGYNFELLNCTPAKPDGPIIKYQIVAYPEASPENLAKKGLPAYCSDQSDVIRMARNGSGEECLTSGVELSENEITHPNEWSNDSSSH